MRHSIHCLFFALLLTSSAAPAKDYFVSPAGNDASAGTKSRPWRSIEKLNTLNFQPGDRIYFEGGKTFAGTLQLDASDSGSEAARLLVTSYGSGRAVIDGGNGRAISADGCNYVTIRNLKLRGNGRKTGNTASGLVLANAAHVEADQIEVTGFRRAGVDISGVQNGRITRIHAHQNGFAGISTGPATSRKLYVGYCLTENNPGDPTVRKNHSGNGIVIGHAQGAVVEYNEARYNGWDQPWTGNGPVGIWTYQSDRVIIQFNVAHHNRSTAADGGGFDFDGGVTNSILQYNYSHSNYGAGYLICQYEGAGLFENNIVRYNISQDDGLKDHDAGIFVWVGGANMKSTLVHNNTIFNTRGAAVAFGVSKKYVDQQPVIAFYNNIFVSQGPSIRGDWGPSRFLGNLYFGMGERPFRAGDFKDFDEWVKATGQETHNGRVVGRFIDPMLAKDGNGLLTDPLKLKTLVEYFVLPKSPAIDTGLNLRELFGIDPGKRDFYGTPLPQGGGFDIGAYEFVHPAAKR